MVFLKWTVLLLLTMFIGAIAGFGLVIRKVHFQWYHLTFLFVLSFLLSRSSVLLGSYFTSLSIKVLEVIIGLGYLGIAVQLLRFKPRYPGGQDLFLFAVVIQLQVMILSLHYMLKDQVSYTFSLFIAFLPCAGLVGGMTLAQKRWSNWRIIFLLPYIPSFCLMIIGLLKILSIRSL